MKDYTKKTLNKLTELLTVHSDAELRFGRNRLIIGGCKVIESDIIYDDKTNTIYIG